MTKSKVKRILIKLGLPKSPSRLLALAKSVLHLMTGNAYFPTPSPALALIAAAIAALEAAETLAQTKAVGATEARDAKADELRGLLRDLGAYVQHISDATPADATSILRSAGFDVRSDARFEKPDFYVRRGSASGQVICFPKAGGVVAFYEVQYMAPGGAWVSTPIGFKTKVVISGLTVGSMYSFRYRRVVKGPSSVESDWSQTVTFVVT